MLTRRAIMTAAASLPFATIANAQSLTDQQLLIDQATLEFRRFIAGDTGTTIAGFTRAARAIFVVPDLVRGGFILGGEGGTGVLMIRRTDNSFSYPAFLDVAGASIGLQIGGQVSAVMMAIMTERGVNSFLQRRFTLGAGADIAAISEGAGIEARTGLDLNADMYAFSRNEGLFAGGAIEGAFVSAKGSWNNAYYGPGTTVSEILYGGRSNPGADGLRTALLV